MSNTNSSSEVIKRNKRLKMLKMALLIGLPLTALFEFIFIKYSNKVLEERENNNIPNTFGKTLFGFLFILPIASFVWTSAQVFRYINKECHQNYEQINATSVNFNQ